MKTVTIKFREYSKEYDFTAPDFIQRNDFVLVYTQEQFSVVRVVDTCDEVNDKNKEIIAKVNVNTDIFQRFYEYKVFEIVKCNDKKYNVSLFETENYTHVWQTLDIVNALFDKKKTLYLAESNYSDITRCYKTSSSFEKDIANMDLIEVQKEELQNNLSEDDLMQIEFKNKGKLVEKLSKFETSFLKNNDEFYAQHPVIAIRKFLKESEDDLRVFTEKNYDESLFEKPEEISLYDNYDVPKDHKHYEELSTFVDELYDAIDRKQYYGSESITCMTHDEYVDYLRSYYEEEHVDYRHYSNMFSVNCFREIKITDNYTEIEPVLRFHIQHYVNLIANMVDLNMKYQQIDIEY